MQTYSSSPHHVVPNRKNVAVYTTQTPPTMKENGVLSELWKKSAGQPGGERLITLRVPGD